MKTDPVSPHHDHKTLTFPKGFLWGSSTSAHQVEGHNTASDWWHFERSLPPHLRSNDACDHYNRFKNDFQLAKDLGHNAHRLSIEWARIESKPGEFDHHEIEHYIEVLQDLKKKNFTVMLTLWHFTLPQWIAEQGGWNNPKTVSYFVRFIERIVPDIKEYVDFWITLNEPALYTYMLFESKEWPGGNNKWYGQYRMFWNLTSAHRQAYKTLHRLTPTIPVGIANNFQSFTPFHKHSLTEQLAVMSADITVNHMFYWFTRNCHDFLGVNYYFHNRIKHLSISDIIHHNTLDSISNEDANREVSDLGWEIYPEGIYEVLTDLMDHKPIYITECGIASTNDDRRTRFLINYLSEIYRAIAEGVNVKGFFYWSLLDNFEWHRGFDPRFGLVEVDYKTQKRTPRPSSKVYKTIIEHNGIPHDLLQLLGHGMQVEKVLKDLEKK